MLPEKHYVLQYNRYHDDKYTSWKTLPCKYSSFAEAEAARKRMLGPSCYRVAESYIVVRYKAVKQ